MNPDYKYLPFIIFLAVLAAFFSPIIWVLVAGILFVMMILLWKERFLIMFVIAGFLTLTTTISPVLRLIIQIVSIVFLMAFFLKNNYDRPIELPKVPGEMLKLIIAVVVLMMISTFFSEYRVDGMGQLTRTLVFLLIIYLIYSLIQAVSEVKLVINTLILVGVFYSAFLIYELYQAGFVFVSLYEQQTIYLGLEYLGKNHLGGFLSAMILLVTALAFRQTSHRKYLVFIVFFMMAGLILTSSRAAILSFFIAVCVLLFILNKRILLYGFITALVIFLIVLLTPVYDYLILYARIENIASGRDFLIEGAKSVITNHFFLGAGPGATKYEMYNHLPFLLGSPQELMIRRNFLMGELGQAHSFYLFFFSDMGIFGFMLSLMFPVVYFRMITKIIRHYTMKESYEYYLFRGFIAFGVFMFVRGILEPAGIFTFGNLNGDILFWLVISIISFYHIRIPAHE